jgi:hypothetical protein
MKWKITFFSLKSLLSYLLSAIVALLETGWVNRLSRPLNRFSPGGNRLNRFWPPRRQSARSLRCQLRSLRCQFRSLRCQTARNFAQSTPFPARFYCAVWPETGWTGFLRSDRPTPPLFLSLSPLIFFSVSLSNRRRPLFLLSLLHTFSTPRTHLCPLNFERFVGDSFIPAFSIIFINLVGISCLNLRIEVLPYFIPFYSILRVLDYLMYHSLGTF